MAAAKEHPMSTDNAPSLPSSPPAPRPSRLRRFLVGSALVVFGAMIGVGTTALSQDYGPRRGWHDDGPRGGPGGSGRLGWHGGPMGGGPFLTPGRIERLVDRGLWAADASSDQKQKITAILRAAADDLYALRQKHLDGRKEIADTLAAPTIDRDKLETLRAQQMQLAEAASKRLTAAVADAGDVLTPAQRAELAKRIEERGRWFRG